MIKINLTKNKSDTQIGTSAEFETAFDTSFGEGSVQEDTPVVILVKILICVSGIIGLWGYESYNIGNLKEERANLSATVTEARRAIDEKKDIAAKAQVLQKEIEALQGRINAVKELSKSRLREIKVVDFLQNVLPEKVWLDSINIDNGAITLTGNAMSDEDLNRFFANIDGRSFLRDVYIKSATEQRTLKATIKSFVILARLADSE